jgi:hypothetical protein
LPATAGADVLIGNPGTQAGNTTTISGSVTADDAITIINTGLTSSKLDITGKLTAGGDLQVLSNGHLTIKTAMAGGDIDLEALGTTLLRTARSALAMISTSTRSPRRPSCCLTRC